MGFEPTTPTLARLCSTPELHPLTGPESPARRLYGVSPGGMQQEIRRPDTLPVWISQSRRDLHLRCPATTSREVSHCDRIRHASNSRTASGAARRGGLPDHDDAPSAAAHGRNVAPAAWRHSRTTHQETQMGKRRVAKRD